MVAECPLCRPQNETILWRDDRCRAILVDDPDYPGYCRVIWGAHVAELTDLAPADRLHLLAVVGAVEEVLRERLRPTKMNLASLGNQVPHLHWHVIARFSDDAHYPDPIWAARRRPSPRRDLDRETLRQRLARDLDERCAEIPV